VGGGWEMGGESTVQILKWGFLLAPGGDRIPKSGGEDKDFR